jgi:multidrug efflux pump subunit AcrB
MDFAAAAIKNRTVTLVFSFVALVGGMYIFQESMSRLEDPEFTIKEALIITPYPGATSSEVEEEVTDLIELAVQQLGQVRMVESKSDRGLSTITVEIQKSYDNTTLPQVWDELRRKVNDAQRDLPPGAGPSLVNDDFGDVFGVFATVYGPEYSYAELEDVVDLLRRELVLVQDVAKIETFGERTEAVYVELSRDRLSQIGITDEQIVSELRNRNLVSDAGKTEVGPEFITLEPTGGLETVEEFESILVSSGAKEQIYLRDFAKVRRHYVEPRNNAIRFDGSTAIGIGISTVSGGNAVTMGEAVHARMQELSSQLPLGISFGIVSLQSEAVEVAIGGFVLSLMQAVVIVVVVLLLFMGLRSALLIGFILVLTISASFIFLDPMGVALERISLGALIIALGMLVDNAIVVVDGVLIRLEKGEDAAEAASAVVAQSSMPLLGATVIAILAFAAIGTSEDSTGEFCRSLFQVVLVSLLLSWVTAVTVTPLLCLMILKSPEAGAVQEDSYGGAFYDGYRKILRACIRMRVLTMGVVVGLFASSLYGFGFIDTTFFPPSTRPQFMVDLWLPKGTHIDTTTQYVEKAEQYLLAQEGVEHVTSLVGQGGLRFLLTYSPEKLDSGYAQFLVDVEDASYVGELIPKIEAAFAEQFPSALSYGFRFELGPGEAGKVRPRFSGDDANQLRRLAEQAEAILEADGDAKGVRNDWRDRVKVVRPVIEEDRANLNGIQRADVSAALRQGFQGLTVGVYREDDKLLPIILRAEEAQQENIDSIRHLQIWSPVAQTRIPLRQVISSFDTGFEDDVRWRRDRRPTITVFADPKRGSAAALFARVRPAIEAIELPPDYFLEWGGEYEDSNEAREGLTGPLPLFFLLMLLVTIALFNSLRQPAIIWLCVPLALIGVSYGLLGTGQPFGFMAILGFLSLSGMLIKNAIVLIDQINLELSSGKELIEGIVDSGVSRLRPVAMAASTTALGMVPLLFDAFFVAMAVTIIAGLVFATVLTMIVVPVLYSIFYSGSQPTPAADPTASPS